MEIPLLTVSQCRLRAAECRDLHERSSSIYRHLLLDLAGEWDLLAGQQEDRIKGQREFHATRGDTTDWQNGPMEKADVDVALVHLLNIDRGARGVGPAIS
jgi:hypothetical protein